MASNGLSVPFNSCQYHSRLRTLLGEIQEDSDIDFHVENTPATDDESDSDLTDSDDDSDASTVYDDSEQRYAHEDGVAEILCGEFSSPSFLYTSFLQKTCTHFILCQLDWQKNLIEPLDFSVFLFFYCIKLG